MKIGFYLHELNYRGIAKSTFDYANYNEKILKNKSFIFYNSASQDNKKNIKQKFYKRFKTYSIHNLEEIKKKEKELNFIYFQRAGHKDRLITGIKNLIHVVFPHNFLNHYGDRYCYISSWLSKGCSNNKYPYVPLILESFNDKSNLRKLLKIPSEATVFGCHGGQSSFDLIFVKDAIKNIIKDKNNIYFIFVSIEKFISHPNVFFLKDASNINRFINTCDAMIHARSLGESFGLACGEFAVKNKPIFTFKFCRQRAHINNYKEKIFLYESYKDIYNKIFNFNKYDTKYHKNFKNIYKPIIVMKKFDKIFLKNNPHIKKINTIDIVLILSFYFFIFYNYFRFKIYIFFYKLKSLRNGS